MEPLFIASAVLGLLIVYFLFIKQKDDPRFPPTMKALPWVGVARQFGEDPVKLMKTGYKKFGEIWSMTIFGERITLLCGPDANQLFFTAREDQFNAQHAYRFTVPVFGKGIVYDCEGELLIEQKKFMKTGLSTDRFRKYVDLIADEVHQYFDKYWGDSGEKDLLEAFSQVTVFTSIRCLQGPEVRESFTLQFADLYNDLDAALSPVGFFFPNLPLPAMRRRDSARAKLVTLFEKIIKNRESSKDEEYDDLLATFMESEYKDGRKLTTDEIVGLLIALLLAGQHTSNVTSTWLGCMLLANPKEKEKLIEEQKRVLNGEALDYDKLKQMELLDRAMAETLRMRPPICIIMRRVLEDVAYKNYIIPKGSLVAASPTLNHNLEDFWTNPEKFDPERFSPERKEDRNVRYSYIPFGNGRHQCTGEQFGYLQVKTIWSTMLRKYNMELTSKFPEPNFTTLIAGPTPPVMVKYQKIK